VADGVIAEAHAVESKEIKPFAARAGMSLSTVHSILTTWARRWAASYRLIDLISEHLWQVVSAQESGAGRLIIDFWTRLQHVPGKSERGDGVNPQYLLISLLKCTQLQLLMN
jgi:hypothetical protein